MQDMAKAMGLTTWQAAFSTIKDLEPHLVNSRGKPDQGEGEILLSLPEDTTPEEVQMAIDALHNTDSPCPVPALPYFWIPTEEQKERIICPDGKFDNTSQIIAEDVLAWCKSNRKVVIPEDIFDRIVKSALSQAIY
ncbi:MAG: hypothetical protein ABH835_04270 [Patescibacteria group bacterium]